MSLSIAATCVLIVCARIGDVSLGTLRMLAVVNGRARLSWILAFFEILIWIFAVSKVILNLNEPAFAVAYALGYATGNYVGVRVEKLLAFGEQVVRVFTRKGSELAAVLRREGYRVTEFDGRGRDGLVALLFIEVKRKQTPNVLERVHVADPQSFCLVDDIRLVTSALLRQSESAGWLSILKKK